MAVLAGAIVYGPGGPLAVRVPAAVFAGAAAYALVTRAFGMEEYKQVWNLLRRKKAL
jgi:hypothetical protein